MLVGLFGVPFGAFGGRCSLPHIILFSITVDSILYFTTRCRCARLFSRLNNSEFDRVSAYLDEEKIYTYLYVVSNDETLIEQGVESWSFSSTDGSTLLMST